MQQFSDFQVLKVYSVFYRSLHWLMAVMIIILIVVGTIMADLPDTASQKNQMYMLHKSFGFMVLLLAILRVGYRIKNGAVPPLSSLTPLERKASNFVHYALLVLIVVMPLTGYIATSACCAPLKLFGVLNVGLPIALSDSTVKLLFLVHNIAGKAMALLILGHIGAALMHHFVKKDGVLRRMLKGE